MRQRGSILVALLWVVALLALVVTGVLHQATLDQQVVRNQGDRVQAHYLAVAAIERTKALIHRDVRERRTRRVHHTGTLYRDSTELAPMDLGRGRFRVIRPGTVEESGQPTAGIIDEESRLNLNVAEAAELQKIQGMRADVIAAVVDWRDGDEVATAGGAEIETYAASQPPSRPRNGPFLTVRELLMVRGVTPQDFFGNAREQGVGAFPEEGAGSRNEFPPGPAAEGGWSQWLTVDSGVANLNALGEARVNLQTADETALTGVSGITPEIARAIIAHRGRQQFENIFGLLDVGPPPPPGAPPDAQGNPAGGPGGPGGAKVIDEQLLIDIADFVTVGEDEETPGVINVNTAGVDVLACLPGIDRDLAQAIISRRQANGFFGNLAELLRVPGLSREVLQPILKRLTVRSETFRILGEGYLPSTGTRRRVQEVVRLGSTDFITLSHREDDL